MRDVAAFSDVMIKLCLSLQQVVGLQKGLTAKEILTPCKSIDLQSKPATESAGGFPARNEGAAPDW